MKLNIEGQEYLIYVQRILSHLTEEVVIHRNNIFPELINEIEEGAEKVKNCDLLPKSQELDTRLNGVL